MTESQTPWRRAVYRIRQRCNDPKLRSYKNYGARGIECRITFDEVKALWKRDGAAKMKEPSIDRIDNDGHYEFSNCRFIEKVLNTTLSSRANAPKRSKCAERHPGVATLWLEKKSGPRIRERWCAICSRIYLKEYKLKKKALAAQEGEKK